ncbi:hypothetical protein GF406_09175 [candidate division KSB1 bacterium]|nr:hypothetical protein [candidate division KSB1 bacterium]
MSNRHCKNMKLLISTPEKVYLSKEVSSVIVDTAMGSMGFLERHIDFVTAIKPGILTLRNNDGREEYVALFEGILIKQANTIDISTRHALQSDNLPQLEESLERYYKETEQKEKKAKSSLAMLEGSIIKQFQEQNRTTYE